MICLTIFIFDYSFWIWKPKLRKYFAISIIALSDNWERTSMSFPLLILWHDLGKDNKVIFPFSSCLSFSCFDIWCCYCSCLRYQKLLTPHIRESFFPVICTTIILHCNLFKYIHDSWLGNRTLFQQFMKDDIDFVRLIWFKYNVSMW